MLRVTVVLASLIAVAACKSDDKKPATESKVGSAGSGTGTGSAGSAAPVAAKPASTLEQVKAWAPKGTTVKAAELKVPGVELFAVMQDKLTEDDYEAGALAGVVGGQGGKVVEGRELIKAVGDAKADAKTIARVALWAYQEEGELLDKPGNREQTKAHVTAPTIKGTTLKLWVWLDDPPKLLERGTVELATGALELGPLPVKPDVLISNAIRTLAASNVRRYPRAIELLAKTCAEPRSQQTLFAVLSSHARDQTRVAVTEEIHKCGAVAVDPLIFSMEHDKSAMVRAAAATALGRVGAGRARPALAKAARGEDANLVWAAKNALSKIN